MKTIFNSLRHLRAALAVALICGALPAFGTTFTVTNTSDSGPGSLRDAIANAAASGDTINFNLQYPATIPLLSSLAIRKSLTINGPGSSNLTIDAGGNDQVFTLYGAVNISDVTIQGGSSLLGGCIFNASSVILQRVVVQFCNTDNQLGGGIFNGGTMILANSSIRDNVAGTNGEIGKGGGIYNGTDLGVYLGGTLTIINSAIQANRAIGEQAGQPCGGVANPPTSCGLGGGIYNHGGNVEMEGSTVEFNDALVGGGIYDEGGTLGVSSSTISGNSSTTDGAGIELSDGDETTILSSTISNNTVDSTFSCCTGVGISQGQTSKLLTVTNSTISGNLGDGIIADSAIRVAFTTITNNLAGVVGLFIPQNNNSRILENSILSNNNGANCSFNAQGLSSLGHNLSDDASCAAVFTQLGDLNSTPAGLDPSGLRNNGGPTQTIALEPGSAAINAVPLSFCVDGNGQAVTTDQRGDPRPKSTACDMGAFEFFITVKPIIATDIYHIWEEVKALKIASKPKTTLLSETNAAATAVNHGEKSLAIRELNLFVSSVASFERSKVLTSKQASLFTSQAQAVIKKLSGATTAESR